MRNTLPLKVSAETPEFQSWFSAVVKLNGDYMAKNFPNNPKDVIVFVTGRVRA